MVDDYEYEAGTLNEIWENFSIKEDAANDRLVFQRQGASKTELFEMDSDGALNPEKINNVVYVSDASDLPDPTNGTHSLEDDTGYHFTDFVFSDYGLELGTRTPLAGFHGSLSGFVHTGGATAITGSNSGYFAKDMYIHAPGGTIHDLSGDQSTEVLVESVSYNDAAGLGNIASLGTIDGFRVPSWKGCNFGNFDGGFTFTGTPDKIYFTKSPFREVTASNVQIITLDESLRVNLVDLPNNYVKDVQSDTEVVHVEPADAANERVVTEQLQYRGTLHDTSVVASNILTGEANKNEEPYWVESSYPLSNTSIYGGYDIDSSGTVSISTQASNDTDEAAYEPVDLATSDTGLARFTHTSPNQITYIGQRDRTIEFDVSVAGSTGNSEVLAVAVFQNGNLLPDSATKFVVSATSFAGGTTISGNGSAKVVVEDVQQNDSFDIRIANLGSTTDIDISEMAVDSVTT